MVVMADGLTNDRSFYPPDQPSPLIAPHPHAFPYPNSRNRDLRSLQAEELLRTRNLARIREAFQLSNGVDGQRNLDVRNFPVEIQKQCEWIARNEEYQTREHLEKDAYFRANQEYLRLMNEDVSRQHFREKQRLTEDLEKQKRALIEDLARGQQLRQDKYKRNQSTAYSADIRMMHIMNEKGLRNDVPAVIRGNLEHINMHPVSANNRHYNPRLDVRFPPPITSPNDPYTYRKLQENFQSGKASTHPRKDINNSHVDKQCVHSDLSIGAHSLMPIIQEKEKEIKEMEERLLKLTREENPYNSVQSTLIEQQYKNNIGKQRYPLSQHPSQYVSDKTREERVEDENNNRPASSDQITPFQNGLGKKRTSPSPVEDLIIDVTEEQEEASEQKVESPKNKQVGIEKEEFIAIKQEQSVSKPAECNDEINNIKNGIEIKEASKRDMIFSEGSIECIEEKPYEVRDKIDENKTLVEVKVLNKSINNGGSDNENNEQNMQTKSQKKRSKHKPNHKKEDLAPDFQASQNRLALDLPGHNWLVERLMQQKKLGAEDITVAKVTQATDKGTADKESKEVEDLSDTQQKEPSVMKDVKELNDNEIKILSVMSLRDTPTTSPEKGKVYTNANETNTQAENNNSGFSNNDTENNNILDERNSKSNNGKGTKWGKSPKTSNLNTQSDPVHTSLLLKMLDPKKSNPQLSSPNRINPPEANTSTKYQQILPKNITKSPQNLLQSNSSPTENKEKNNATSTTSSGTVSVMSSTTKSFTSAIDKYKKDSPPMLPLKGKISNSSEGDINSPTSVSSINGKVMTAQSPHALIPCRKNSDGSAKDKDKTFTYPELRPNLVVMTRKESDNQTYAHNYGSNFQYPHPTANQTPYSKMIVEERYNRKRPFPEERRDYKPGADVHEKPLALDLDRNAQVRRTVSEIHRIQIEHDIPRRMIPSAPPAGYPRNSQDDIRPHDSGRISEAAVSGTLNYLSRFKESNSQPPLASPARVKTTDILDAQTQYSKRRDLPSSFIHLRTGEKPADENLLMLDRRMPGMERMTEIESRYENHLKQNSHPETVADPLLHRQLAIQYSRERELRMLEQAQKREDIQRVEQLRKESGYPVPTTPVVRDFRSVPNSILEDPLASINERVRTVEDLRALQMGLPIDNTLRQYRPPHIIRNERLTEREKVALREAEVNSHLALRQEGAAHRQSTHNAFLEHARREGAIAGKIHPPAPPVVGGPHLALNNEQLRLLGFRKQEERLRAHEDHQMRMSLGEQNEHLLLSANNELPQNRVEPNTPRFFSHKIPRTRDGSLDFGRSKPVDYSFLDYSAGIREREGLSLKRPSSANAAEPIQKLQRRTPPQTHVSAELYKRLSHDELKQKESEKDTHDDKWKNQDNAEKRSCKICGKGAQYLCSGCRKAWYCSQSCQLSEWRSHSKTCSGAER